MNGELAKGSTDIDTVYLWWRLKRGTEQVAERRNEGTEQLQIVEEPVMNGTIGCDHSNAERN